jgi:hypothetical protein
MKTHSSLLLALLLLSSCNKQYEDAIPEGATLGFPNLVANLNEEGRIMLNWNISRFCAGWTCDPVVEGSSHDVFVKFSSFSDLAAVDILSEGEYRNVYNIYGIDFNNSVQMIDLVISPWNETSSSFSPFEENLLAFISDRSGRRQVWVKDISNGKLKQVSFLKDDLYISSNGNIISWVDQGQSLAFPVTSPTGDQKLIKIPIPN